MNWRQVSARSPYSPLHRLLVAIRSKQAGDIPEGNASEIDRPGCEWRASDLDKTYKTMKKRGSCRKWTSLVLPSQSDYYVAIPKVQDLLHGEPTLHPHQNLNLTFVDGWELFHPEGAVLTCSRAVSKHRLRGKELKSVTPTGISPLVKRISSRCFKLANSTGGPIEEILCG